MRLMRRHLGGLSALAFATCAGVYAQDFQSNTDVLLITNPNSIELLPAAPEVGYELRIALPDGSVKTETFEAGVIPEWTPSAGSLMDGVYTYELRAVPAGLQQRFEADGVGYGAHTGDAVVATGHFSVADGTVVPVDVTEPRSSSKTLLKATVLATNDGVVRNSLCVGIDCPDSPSFGFDTIRVQENNTRFHFDDTSTGTFPANDWRLVANDSANGGASYLAVEDATAARQVFRVSAGARSNALFLSNTSRLGMGTSTPVLDFHIATGNTPAIRLDQTSAGGFTPQVWDMAGNEANFFVRDVTNGSLLPLRIRPGAPTSSIDVGASGNVGIGTPSPSTSLHVRRTNGTAMLRVEEASGTAAPRELFRLTNNGGPFVIFEDTSLAQTYSFAMGATGHFLISHQQTAGVQFRMTQTGDVTIAGTLTEGSSREIKQDIVPVDPATVLAKLDLLPITEWSYEGAANKRHIGPLAEDFYATFSLGPDDKHVAPKDMAGVALAAAKALKRENEELRARNADLEARIERLERVIQKLN